MRSERYVDARELAEVMGVSVPTVRRWTRGGMPSENWGMKRTRRFLISECLAWAKSRNATVESSKSAATHNVVVLPTQRSQTNA